MALVETDSRWPADPISLSLQRLPNEMWISVFETLSSPSDLLAVTQTCKYFHSLAIRVLYRDIQWLSPFHYANNMPFWEHPPPNMALVPSSLTITVSLVNTRSFSRYDTAITVVEMDGSCKFRPSNQAIQALFPHANEYHHSNPTPQKIFASSQLYADITKRISTFKMLRELVFHLCELPDSIFSMLKLLPRLKSLFIQYCALPDVRLEPDNSLSELPITELTLWSLKGDGDTVLYSNYVYTLHLCTAKNLKILRIDWNPVTGRFLSCHNRKAPMTSIPTLEEVAIRFPNAKVWPPEDGSPYKDDPLTTFLSGSPKIKRFTCQNRRTNFRFNDTVMPELTYYHGAMAPAQELVASRKIEHLELSDADKKMSDTLSTLKQIAFHRPQLQTLRFNVFTWDDEILYALTSLFDDLRKLRIRFAVGHLSEQTLLSLGSQFLHRFPRLETLQIYRSTYPPSGSGDVAESTTSTSTPARSSSSTTLLESVEMYINAPADDDGEVKASLNAWKKACPNLTEVQLTEKFVWRRAFSGDEWCKRSTSSSATGFLELF